MTTTKVTIPAGSYWIGDPCYSVPDDEWRTWLEAADYTNPSRDHLLYAELDPARIALGVSTAYGDGEYPDNLGRAYGVDAGLIGLVSTAWPGTEGLVEEAGLRYLLEIDEPIDVESPVSGLISIGYIEINTADDPDGDDEDEDEDELTYECPVCGDGHEGESGSELCESCQADEDRETEDEDDE